MKTFSVILLSFLFVLFNSCGNDSNWRDIIIPADQELVFLGPSGAAHMKSIVVITNERDTLFVQNRNLVLRISYLRLAYPENSIRISYVETKKHDKKVLDPRFVYLEE